MTDLRQAADMIKGKKVADSVRAIVVPGSQSVKLQAEKKGLTRFSWKLDLNGESQAAACV